MSYNITQLQEAENLMDIFTYANESSSNILIGSFMIAIFFVLLMAFRNWDLAESLMASSFVCLVLSMMLVYAELLTFMFPLFFLALLAFTGFFVYTRR